MDSFIINPLTRVNMQFGATVLVVAHTGSLLDAPHPFPAREA